jgi:hypothetical protein
MALLSTAHITSCSGQHILLEHKFEKGTGDGKNGISMVKEENNM